MNFEAENPQNKVDRMSVYTVYKWSKICKLMGFLSVYKSVQL